MKVRELLNEDVELTLRKEIIDWCFDRVQKGKLQFKMNVQSGVDTKPPHKVSCELVDFAKTAIFKNSLPVHFAQVDNYIASDCKYLTDLNQLRVDKVGSLNLIRAPLTSLNNCPSVKKIILSSCPITSLKGLNPDVEQLTLSFCKDLLLLDEYLPKLKTLYAPAAGLTSLKDIHKMIPNVESLQINSNDIKSNILGLLMLRNLKWVIYSTGDATIDSETPDFIRACSILEKYLKNKDILECQEELISNELKEYAKL